MKTYKQSVQERLDGWIRKLRRINPLFRISFKNLMSKFNKSIITKLSELLSDYKINS